jgi:hypothetical protein
MSFIGWLPIDVIVYDLRGQIRDRKSTAPLQAMWTGSLFKVFWKQGAHAFSERIAVAQSLFP